MPEKYSRNLIVNAGNLIIGILILFVIVISLQAVMGYMQVKSTPSGWEIIRPPHDVEAFALSGDILWAGGRDGVVGISRHNGTIVKEITCSPPITYIQAVFADPDGTLYIGHQTGLSQYRNSTCKDLTGTEGFPYSQVNVITKDYLGRMWAGTWDGAMFRKNGVWKTLRASDGLLDPMVNVILADSRGGMWFGSYTAPRGGISIYREGTWQYFTTDNGLPHNNINAIIEDSNGYVWAGTGLYQYGGAVRFSFNGSAWVLDKTIKKDDGLCGEKVRSLFQDRQGNLWFGSEYDGVAVLNNGTWKRMTTTDGLSNNEIKCMLQDDNNSIWLGTHDGISKKF